MGVDDCFLIISSRFHSLGIIYDLAIKSLRNGKKVVLLDCVGVSDIDIGAESKSSLLFWKLYRKIVFKTLLKIAGVKYYTLSQYIKQIATDDLIDCESIKLNQLFEKCAFDHYIAIYGMKPKEEEKKVFFNVESKLQFYKNYLAFVNFNSAIKAKRYLFFNGRHPILTTVDYLKKDLNYKVLRSEILSGASLSTMRIINSEVNFFDFLAFSDYLLLEYNNADPAQKETDAKNYFSRRFSNRDYFIAQIAKNWKPNLSIFKNKDAKLKIAFYLSSIDEFPAFEKIDSSIDYEDQIGMMFKIINILEKNNQDYEMVVKLHPRTIREKKLEADYKQWKSVVLPNNKVRIISDNAFSPFELLEQSNLVIASSSTLAVDATYVGKKAISLGPNFFTNHDASWFCRSWNQFERVLLDDKEPISPKNTYPFAWCMEVYGEYLEYYSVKKISKRNIYFLNTGLFKVPII